MNFINKRYPQFSYHLLGFLIFLIVGFPPSQAQVYNGNITFYSQAQVDTFPPYTIITGNVSFNALDITHVDSLYNLTEVQGYLWFNGTDSLASLAGLSNLTTVGEFFYINTSPNSPNQMLTDLSGLENLSFVGEEFKIDNFPALNNVDGLTSLTTIGEELTLRKTGMQNIDGLANLDSVEEITISYCDNLMNVDGLIGITHLKEGLFIFNNAQLLHLNGLVNLEHCGELRISANASLTSIAGLASLRTIGPLFPVATYHGDVYIFGNISLPSLNGLQSLERISGDVTIGGSDLITNVDPLSQLDSVYGELKFFSNSVLQDVYGLRNVSYYGDVVKIYNNDILNECCGIYPYVDSVGIAAASQYIYSNAPRCTADTIFNEGPCAAQDSYYLVGSGYFDIDGDCQKDSTDFPASYQIVQALPGPIYGSTDANGNYQIAVDTGSYEVSILPSRPNSQSCDTSFSAIILSSDSLVSIPDWGIQRDSCPDIQLNLGGLWYRRCFQGNLQIQYCNWGLLPSSQTQLSVRLPKYVHLLSASLPYTYAADSTILFDLGTVDGEYCGTLNLITEVSCSSIELLGLTQCIEAWVSSPDFCPLSAPNWSGASLAIQPQCLDSINQFTLINQGQGDMIDSTSYRIYADEWLVQTGKVILDMGDSVLLQIPSDGQMYRLEVDQEENHPTNSLIAAALEGCVEVLDSTVSKGLINDYPLPIRDPDPSFSVSCRPIIGAYDPNDKQVFPSGFGQAGLTRPGSRLQYLIRFQNTGNDTAFNVFLIDTLSLDLDLSTFQIESASHPYRFEVSGQGNPILSFYFDDILLPDSNVNEPASHGFIRFSIDHQSDAPLGTEIENFADIYFDFNPPIRTNTVLSTLSLFQEEMLGSISGIELSYHPAMTTSLEALDLLPFSIFPNPADKHIQITGTRTSATPLTIEWLDLQGRLIQRSVVSVPQGRFNIQEAVPEVSSGLYLIRLDGQTVQKIVID